MKELSTRIIVDPEIRIEQQQIKKKLFVGSMRIQKGQKCYELNLNTGLIVEANVIEESALNGYVKRRLDTNEDCIYITAINMFNAKRKFVKRLYNKIHN